MTITGTSFTGATVVDFGTTAATNVDVVNDTTITADSPAGTGTVDVTVTTPAGVSATTPADQFTYTVAATPTVAGLSPNHGSAAGGTPVTISGTGFTGATALDFGTTPATDLHVVNDTMITADSPAGTGVVNVTVTTPGGTSAVTPADEFTYTVATAPAVTGLSPSSGPEAGGTLVTITGTSFTGATAVDFGTTAATNVTVVNDTTITADSPAGTGTVDVTVITPAGTSATSPADHFTYIVAPAVTGLSPTSGTAAGGTPVTITGTGFTGATAVDFGTTAATNVVGGERHLDHGGQPCWDCDSGRDGDDPRGHVAHVCGRSIHLHRGRRAVGHGLEPGERFRGRRHSGDDQRDRVHRRDCGRLRNDGSDESRRWSTIPRSRPTARLVPVRWT